jgi:hypothetical protein
MYKKHLRIAQCPPENLATNAALPIADEPLPKDWQPVGTLPYSCLEAVQHSTGTGGGLDLRLADAYSAGATLFELLTGRLPVEISDEDRHREDQLDDIARISAWEQRLLRRVRPPTSSTGPTMYLAR